MKTRGVLDTIQIVPTVYTKGEGKRTTFVEINEVDFLPDGSFYAQYYTLMLRYLDLKTLESKTECFSTSLTSSLIVVFFCPCILKVTQKWRDWGIENLITSITPIEPKE